jgi:hypothetical protein
MERVLLLDEELMKTTLAIDDNLASGYIRPAIILAQDIYLEETIGTSLMLKLKECVVAKMKRNEAIPKVYKTLLDKVQKMLAHYATSYIIDNVSGKVSNAGVLRTEDEKMTSLSASELAERKAWEIQYGDMYRGRLQNFLIANYNDYPELKEWRSIADLKHQLHSAASCGLWLGGVGGKKSMKL